MKLRLCSWLPLGGATSGFAKTALTRTNQYAHARSSAKLPWNLVAHPPPMSDGGVARGCLQRYYCTFPDPQVPRDRPFHQKGQQAEGLRCWTVDRTWCPSPIL